MSANIPPSLERNGRLAPLPEAERMAAKSKAGNCSFCAAFPAPPPAPEPEAHKPAARELKALLRTLGLPTDGSLAELAGRVQVALSGDGP